jgi:hydrogenase nickel incorporation protein HypB
MGRFHRHEDGTAHSHDHPHEEKHHHHDHELGDLSSYQTGVERVQVLERIFEENDAAAAANRAALEQHGVHCVNLMSSPGAGKTTLLERTLGYLRDQGVRAGLVEGDIETALDADRLGGLGAQVSLVNTGNGFGGECHLDAPMVARALAGLRLNDIDLLLVENVGNLVCPAEFDVGAHRSVMVHAITEGEDKPLKYPVMFRAVDVVLVNKMDLLPHLEVDLGLLRRNIAAINPAARIIELSARTGAGVRIWHEWLAETLPARTG